FTFSVMTKPFFFFQAEDGIRDFHVTGVQTCALPIWVESHLLFLSLLHRACTGGAVFIHAVVDLRGFELLELFLGNPLVRTLRTRSEERRVGKDRRSRPAPNKPDTHNSLEAVDQPVDE